MTTLSTPTDVHLSVPARPENVSVVRHVMGAFAEVLDLPRETLEDVRLAVTEACTNVVRHAYDHPDGTIDILIRPHADTLDVTVSDTGRGIPSADREGPGFGLPMIATLTDSLDIDRSTGSGSRVAMSFRRARVPAGTS
jgi:serine/threonine-protein kinase RsbW